MVGTETWIENGDETGAAARTCSSDGTGTGIAVSPGIGILIVTAIVGPESGIGTAVVSRIADGTVIETEIGDGIDAAAALIVPAGDTVASV